MSAAVPGGEVHVVGRSLRGSVTWCGQAAADAASAVEVELDVDDVVDWSVVAVTDEPREVASAETQGISISGLALDLSHDDVLTISLDDSLVMVETTGMAPTRIVGRHVHFYARELRIYPVNY